MLPEETPPVPVVPAVPAPPADPAAAADTTEAELIEKQRKEDSEWNNKLFEDLGYVVKDQVPPKKDEKVADPDKVPDPGTAPAAAAAAAAPVDPGTPAEAKKLKVSKEKDRVKAAVDAAFKERDAARQTETAPAHDPAPAPSATAEPEKDPYEESLGEAERDEINFARYAEKANPDAPWAKGLGKKTVDYFKAVDEYYESARRENPDRTFDESDPEFQEWVAANRPNIPDRRKVERQQIVEEAETRAEAKANARMEDITRRQHALEVKPGLDKKINDYGQGVLETFAQKPEGDKPSFVAPLAEIAKEKGFDGLVEEYPIHGGIVRDHWNSSVALGEEYLRLQRGVAKFDGQNPNHRWLGNFIESQATSFKQQGGEATVSDGRKFLTPAEFNRMAREKPDEINKHWTLSEDDVLGIIQINALTIAEEKLSKLNEQLEKSGYKRTAQGKELPNKETSKGADGKKKAEHESPKAKPSVSPGAAPAGSVNLSDRILSDDEMNLLVTRK